MKERDHTNVQFVIKNSSKCKLNCHIARIHEEKQRHKCSICDKEFPRKGHLNEHIVSVHEGKIPHKCSVCDKVSALQWLPYVIPCPIPIN